jgi:hypothetical protein
MNVVLRVLLPLELENFVSPFQLKHKIFIFSFSPALNLMFIIFSQSCVLFFYAAVLMRYVFAELLAASPPPPPPLQMNTVVQQTLQMSVELLCMRCNS